VSGNPANIRQLSVLMGVVFTDMVGFTIVLPLLPFYATNLGATPFVVTVIYAAYAFAQLSTAPLWGRFSDRLGRRPLILAGLLASAVAFTLFGLAGTLWVFFLSRLFQGSAAGGMTGVVQAYVADSVDHGHRAQALGWVTAATSAGVMIGPAVGSLAARLGQEAPGFIAAGLCLLNALFAWRWLPEPPVRDRGPEPPRRIRHALYELLRHPKGPVISLIWVYALGMLAFMGMNAILVLYLKDYFGVTERTIGYFFVYVGLIGLVMRGLLLGRAVRRFGELGVARLGALSLAVGLGLMPLPGFVAAPMAVRFSLLAVIALLVPVGTALLFPATTALVSQRSPRAEVGQTLGIQQTFRGFSQMIGPMAMGALYGVGAALPFVAAAVIVLFATFLTLRLRDEPQPAPVPAEVSAG
jgi:MFS family permease